jgi:hypothetical protein
MNIERQNIISLLQTADAANIEIAEETAISTGNGKWFCRYINKLLVKIKKILIRTNIESTSYDDTFIQDNGITEKQLDLLFGMSAILGNVDCDYIRGYGEESDCAYYDAPCEFSEPSVRASKIYFCTSESFADDGFKKLGIKINKYYN